VAATWQQVQPGRSKSGRKWDTIGGKTQFGAERVSGRKSKSVWVGRPFGVEDWLYSVFCARKNAHKTAQNRAELKKFGAEKF